ncbi:MAG: hypothetical protein KJ749_14440 [Planctomycetes bacterium]|nr:hypothetical protein [Planctomycetota bacterium]
MNTSERRRPGLGEGPQDVSQTIDLHIRAEKLRQLKLKTQELENATVPREFHEQCLEEVADVLIKAFEELPAAVAPLLAGCTPAEIEAILTERINEIRRRAAGEAASQQARTSGPVRKRRVGRPLKDDQR